MTPSSGAENENGELQEVKEGCFARDRVPVLIHESSLDPTLI
jgi:hypothetical protein